LRVRVRKVRLQFFGNLGTGILKTEDKESGDETPLPAPGDFVKSHHAGVEDWETSNDEES